MLVNYISCVAGPTLTLHLSASLEEFLHEANIFLVIFVFLLKGNSIFFCIVRDFNSILWLCSSVSYAFKLPPLTLWMDQPLLLFHSVILIEFEYNSEFFFPQQQQPNVETEI